jgi:TonB family protein
MTISLDGGTGGPRSGGLNSIGQRPVQALAPPEAPKRPEPVRPPAARAAPMTVPAPDAPRRRAGADVKQAPQDARGTTPTRGAEVTRGAAIAETGVRGQGFGLSTGGQPGFGSFLDVSDFCCPEYIALMLERIRSNWNQGAGRLGESMVRFTIQRDGRLADVILEESSGNAVADQNAQRAVLATGQLPPLPTAFPNPTLTVHLSFRYTR